MQVLPYLQFDGRCEEAIEFYKSALDARQLTRLNEHFEAWRAAGIRTIPVLRLTRVAQESTVD